MFHWRVVKLSYLLLAVLPSTSSQLLGAGTGVASCRAFPYRAVRVDWEICPLEVPCCNEYGFCRAREEWTAAKFRDCNGVTNGIPLPDSVLQLENSQGGRTGAGLGAESSFDRNNVGSVNMETGSGSFEADGTSSGGSYGTGGSYTPSSVGSFESGQSASGLPRHGGKDPRKKAYLPVKLTGSRNEKSPIAKSGNIGHGRKDFGSPTRLNVREGILFNKGEGIDRTMAAKRGGIHSGNKVNKAMLQENSAEYVQGQLSSKGIRKQKTKLFLKPIEKNKIPARNPEGFNEPRNRNQNQTIPYSNSKPRGNSERGVAEKVKIKERNNEFSKNSQSKDFPDRQTIPSSYNNQELTAKGRGSIQGHSRLGSTRGASSKNNQGLNGTVRGNSETKDRTNPSRKPNNRNRGTAVNPRQATRNTKKKFTAGSRQTAGQRVTSQLQESSSGNSFQPSDLSPLSGYRNTAGYPDMLNAENCPNYPYCYWNPY